MRTGNLDHAKTFEFELSQLESSQGKRTGGVSTPAAGWVLSDFAD